ncbi:uncharacterized protein LOC133716446 [Rosa rugosa]|uniref:uncharacterized protein LOC133716446 n=1 Tax=Rosa rugosa TaxID=74645 RepID=UPI002B41696C|nr:uncharacterized protein LOC133716446 [Rosa rugosa]
MKSRKREDHVADLRKVFERMRLHKLKMNPAKCVFEVQAGDFLGFIVHQRGIEVPKNKANAVINASPLRTKKELQRLLGKINFLRRFISNSVEAGEVLENPVGDRFSYSFQLEVKCTNNQAEYEALIIGLEVLLELGVGDVQVREDSLLVINQLREKFRCTSFLLAPYLDRALELLDQFDDADLEHIPRERNFAANELAQLATGITLKYGVRERILKVERRSLPSWLARPDPPDEPAVAILEPIEVDWRVPLIAYLKQPDSSADKKIRFLDINYFLRNDELRQRGEDGIDFRCIYGREAKRLMREVHAGVCGAHQAGPKMRWLIRRHGYYWPSILRDCIEFAKGCQDCQAHGPVQHIPNIPMHPIIKPWPARGWALDLIGMIHPHSSLQHKFIIVATNFFTKWVEAEPLKEASGATIWQFIFNHIICKFGVPEVLVSDRGAAFLGREVE